MDRAEKILLLQVILEDIRGNWGWDLEPRVNKALEIATDLELPQFVDRIHSFERQMAEGIEDGRHFRMHYLSGGYINMEELHGLPTDKIEGRSDEFRKAIDVLVTYPDAQFDDWEDEE